MKQPTTLLTITLLGLALATSTSTTLHTLADADGSGDDGSSISKLITQTNRQCVPVEPMSQGQCQRLAQKWVQFALNPTPSAPACDTQNSNEDTVFNWTPQSPFPAAVYVGPSCPSSCAIKAKKKGKNPRKFCGEDGVTYEDGGCKLAYDCNIFCKSTC